MSIFIFNAESGGRSDVQGMLNAAGFTDLQCFNSSDRFLDALGIGGDGASSAYYARVDLFVLDGISQLKDFEVIGALRRSHRYQDVPIIVTSGSREPEFVQMMFAFGANDYLAKPFQQLELVARVRSCLRLKHEIDRRQAREKELTEVSRQLAELNSCLARLTLLDGLTKVSNRRAFDETLPQEWKRSIRNKSPVSLLMIDVDYFKQYNDSFGHLSGDDCLREIAAGIKASLNRPADFLCRYGGDEFAVVLPDTNLSGARLVADKIVSHVAGQKIPHANTAPSPFVTVTVGGTSWLPSMEDSIQDFVKCADGGLFVAKSRGRNCAEVVEADNAAGAASGAAPQGKAA